MTKVAPLTMPADQDQIYARLRDCARLNYTRYGAAWSLGIPLEFVDAFCAENPTVVFRARNGAIDTGKLRGLAAQGLTCREAAAALGVCESMVRRWAFKNQDVKFARRRRTMHDPAVFGPILRAAIADGLSGAAAARRAGIHADVARHWLRANVDPDLNHTANNAAALARLNPEQRADFDVLMRRGGYSSDVALRMVTAPKAQIRLATPKPPAAARSASPSYAWPRARAASGDARA
jgi:hypothetical protein